MRGTGGGFVGFGVVLLIAGAIMRYAITARADGFDIGAAGLVLLWAGVVMFVLGLAMLFLGSQRHSITESRVQRTPDGAIRTDEHVDSPGSAL